MVTGATDTNINSGCSKATDQDIALKYSPDFTMAPGGFADHSNLKYLFLVK